MIIHGWLKYWSATSKRFAPGSRRSAVPFTADCCMLFLMMAGKMDEELARHISGAAAPAHAAATQV